MTLHDSSDQAIRSTILDLVTEWGGIKSTTLIAMVVARIKGRSVDHKLADVLDRLIEAGEIMEIQFTLPRDTPLHKHFFLLPKGSKIAMLKSGRTAFIFGPDGDIETVTA